MRRKLYSRIFVMTALFTLIFASFASANGKTIPGGPSTEGNTNISSTISYAEMIKTLERIEHTSRGDVEVFTLDEYGKSEQGRSIYVAKVGTGETKIWIQAQIHGNEKLVTEAALQLLKTYAKSNTEEVQTVLEEASLYIIPMYNPDGAEMNTRGTEIQATGEMLDLNRDWVVEDGFVGAESRAVYAYWADLKPDFAIDLHHQGFKQVYGTNESTSFSLGISLAPDGPTLKTTGYEDVTRQMVTYVYNDMIDYGYTHIDRYQVGADVEAGTAYDIDIKGGVVSAMMMGINYNGLNDDGHSNPAIFFETKGSTRDGNLGQKSNGYLTKQNYLALKGLVYGIATEEIYDVDPEDWYDIPYYPLAGIFTDYNGILPPETSSY